MPYYTGAGAGAGGVEARCTVAYAAPRKRYRYTSPEGSRQLAKKEQLKTAPFVTIWFIGSMGQHRPAVLAGLRTAEPASAAAGGTESLVVAESLETLPAKYKAARSKADPVAIFCKAFGQFCASESEPTLRREGKLCAMWSLTGGCDCAPSSPFAHPPSVDTAALRRFVHRQAVPQGWPPLALGVRQRPIVGHGGTACAYWAAAGRARGGRGAGGRGRGRGGGGTGAGPRWRRQRG